jgi:hypothetical protein
MKEPSIAVVVPNWNDARYLPRCLHSVLVQDVTPEELIIVDDQSTDDSVAVIRSLVAATPWAQLAINPVNLGTNGALNEGLRRARSDYVLFLASNDFLLPGIFARAKAFLARFPGTGLWSAMAWLVDEQDRPIRLHPSPVIALDDVFFPPAECVKLAHRFGNWFTGTTLIYHRDTLQTVEGFDPAYGGMADLFSALVVASRRGAAFCPEPFAAIRIHAGSFLHGTLTDLASLDSKLERLAEQGPRMSVQLFSSAFCERTALRFRFATVRASGGEAIAEIATRVSGWKRTALRVMDRLVPARFRGLRVALAFLILRPFDIVPTLWNRAIGWAVIRVRVLLSRRRLR